MVIYGIILMVIKMKINKFVIRTCILILLFFYTLPHMHKKCYSNINICYTDISNVDNMSTKITNFFYIHIKHAFTSRFSHCIRAHTFHP